MFCQRAKSQRNRCQVGWCMVVWWADRNLQLQSSGWRSSKFGPMMAVDKLAASRHHKFGGKKRDSKDPRSASWSWTFCNCRDMLPHRGVLQNTSNAYHLGSRCVGCKELELRPHKMSTTKLRRWRKSAVDVSQEMQPMISLFFVDGFPSIRNHKTLQFLNHLTGYFLPGHTASTLLFHLTPHPFHS